MDTWHNRIAIITCSILIFLSTKLWQSPGWQDDRPLNHIFFPLQDAQACWRYLKTPPDRCLGQAESEYKRKLTHLWRHSKHSLSQINNMKFLVRGKFLCASIFTHFTVSSWCWHLLHMQKVKQILLFSTPHCHMWPHHMFIPMLASMLPSSTTLLDAEMLMEPLSHAVK